MNVSSNAAYDAAQAIRKSVDVLAQVQKEATLKQTSLAKKLIRIAVLDQISGASPTTGNRLDIYA